MTVAAGFPAMSRWLVGSQGRELVGGEGSGWQGAGLRCRHALHAFGRDKYNLVPHFLMVLIAPPIGFKIYDFMQLYPCLNFNIKP